MIVVRLPYTVKRGRMDEAVALAKENMPLYPDLTERVYGSYFGAPPQTIAIELEFESLAAFERWETDWDARPESESWNAKWREVSEGVGVSEIWDLM